jgi:hypothetical protein
MLPYAVHCLVPFTDEQPFQSNGRLLSSTAGQKPVRQASFVHGQKACGLSMRWSWRERCSLASNSISALARRLL